MDGRDVAMLDRAIERWLGDGRDDAPPEVVLERALQLTREKVQRSSLVARTLGAPSAVDAGRRWYGTGFDPRPALAVLIALLLLSAAIVGGGLPRHIAPVVVVPSAFPSPSVVSPQGSAAALPPPRPSCAPSASPVPSVGPTPSLSLAERTISGGGITIVAPVGWHRTSNRTSGRPGGALLQIGTGNFAGTAADRIGVDLLTVDGTVWIDLGQQAGVVSVSGHDGPSLLASTKAAFPKAEVTKTTIGGETGWLIGVYQASFVYPLAALAITWHDGSGYVFTEHLVLDGQPSGAFGTVLKSVTFP